MPMGREAGLRIDRLLLSPSLAKRLARAGVACDVRGWEKASDHAPSWIELNDERKRARRAVVSQVVARNDHGRR
jgi:exodeoxyribonuclease-3